MVFSSVTFLFFFLPIFLTLYFLLPFRGLRNTLILLASLIFYAWGEPVYVVLMIFSILMNYLVGLGLAGEDRTGRKIILLVGLSLNLATLIAFKYADFIILNINVVSAKFLVMPLPLIELSLPLGISFFTFQAMSYLFDVYRRAAKVEKNPFHVALYIAMFPQLIAGPIVRFATIARQIHKRRTTWWRASTGARIFAIGLAQKALIANEVAPIADLAFSSAGNSGLIVAWLGLISYSLQIYFDFAGYSNMAIGLGLILGFTFPRNFNLPYISQSVTEFWRRWHISLSSWFRDYLYIPLGGNRRSSGRTYLNLLLVFLLCGLWHGAAWTFVIWGMHHALFLIIERSTQRALLTRARKPLRHTYTLLAVMTGWVWFRADSLPGAMNYFGGLTGFNGLFEGLHEATVELNGISLTALCLGIYFALQPLFPRYSLGIGAPALVRSDRVLQLGLSNGLTLLFTTACLVLSLASIVSGTHNPFLYFRF